MSGEKTHQRPGKQYHWIEPAHAQAVGNETEEQRADCEGPTEILFEVAVLFFRELELVRDADSSIRQRLTIHIVHGRGEEQQTTDPPLPGTSPLPMRWGEGWGEGFAQLH